MIKNELIVVIIVVLLSAILIAYRQTRKGFSFHKTFVSALIGLIGLAALLLKLLF